MTCFWCGVPHIGIEKRRLGRAEPMRSMRTDLTMQNRERLKGFLHYENPVIPIAGVKRRVRNDRKSVPAVKFDRVEVLRVYAKRNRGRIGLPRIREYLVHKPL